MINAKPIFNQTLESTIREMDAEVSLTVNNKPLPFRNYDFLQDFKVDRVGQQNKYFGFVVAQQATMKLIDRDRIVNDSCIQKPATIKMGVRGETINVFPTFFPESVERDETSNVITVVANDRLASDQTEIKEVLQKIGHSYTIAQLAEACGTAIGATKTVYQNIDANKINTLYEAGANLDGTEFIRDIISAIAEVVQAVAYINYKDELVFKKVDESSLTSGYAIKPENYFTYKKGRLRTLNKITSATELGDNITVGDEQNLGDNQFLYNNPFLELLPAEKIAQLLAMKPGTMKRQEYDIQWRGNFLVEIGDKLTITDTEQGIDKTGIYLLNDTLTYTGGMKQQTKWSYEDKETEKPHSNSMSIGEAINRTYAKVDKANQRIDLAVENINANSEQISALRLTANEISATVSQIETNTNASLEGMNEDIEQVKKEVSTKLDADSLDIAISQVITNGVEQVHTTTGFVFDQEGLTVSKSGKEMTTTITEDGMIIKRNEQAVLTANNEGVKAEDLHATTYLIIGNNSRFEDYGYNRTACFIISS